MSAPPKRAVLLIAHGTVERVDELPDFLTRIRRGHPPPPELVAEVTRRYNAIGGRSPLHEHNVRLAQKLRARLGLEVRLCNRLAEPSPTRVLRELASRQVEELVVLPLAQFSSHIYRDAVVEANDRLDAPMTLRVAANYGSDEGLLSAYAARIARVTSQVPVPERAHTEVVLTAHSLPEIVIEQGDPYAREVSRAAEGVARMAHIEPGGVVPHWRLAYQSQGMSTGPRGVPMKWLGPDLPTTIAELARMGRRRVVFAPIGFLTDHVEILYDLDIEARAWVEGAGMRYDRCESLNSDDDFVEVLAEIARGLLHLPHLAPTSPGAPWSLAP